MNRYIVWFLLVLSLLAFAVIEGLYENVPQPFVQAAGLLTALAAFACVGWSLNRSGKR